jgi:hypothetical protein
MDDIQLEVLHDELPRETLLDFFKQEGIKSIENLKRDCFVNEGGCLNCDSCKSWKANFDYMYKYDTETNRLIRCEDTDDEAIYDFVFYVCDGCNKVSYFIITEP